MKASAEKDLANQREQFTKEALDAIAVERAKAQAVEVAVPEAVSYLLGLHNPRA